MSRRGESVPRPLKRSEFTIRFATRNAEKGWTDLLATARNAVVDAWDFLTHTPMQQSRRNHTMRDALEFVTRDGREYQRWQHELPGGARIWFYVDDHVVWLTEVHSHHPNQTK